ncbi:MAG: hypothetical protein EOP04_29700 [Proteobacteria bacterium]|nr:MAG: hypothetical protein EOP04_29700 [Pseudomonadota bacterium]
MKGIAAFFFLVLAFNKAEASSQQFCFESYSNNCAMIRSEAGKTEIVTDDESKFQALKLRDQSIHATLVSNQEMAQIQQGALPDKHVSSAQFDAYVSSYKALRKQILICGSGGAVCGGLILGGIASSEMLAIPAAVRFFLAGYSACIITISECDEAFEKYDTFKNAEIAYKLTVSQGTIGSSDGSHGNGNGEDLHPKVVLSDRCRWLPATLITTSEGDSWAGERLEFCER